MARARAESTAAAGASRFDQALPSRPALEPPSRPSSATATTPGSRILPLSRSTGSTTGPSVGPLRIEGSRRKFHTSRSHSLTPSCAASRSSPDKQSAVQLPSGEMPPRSRPAPSRLLSQAVPQRRAPRRRQPLTGHLQVSDLRRAWMDAGVLERAGANDMTSAASVNAPPDLRSLITSALRTEFFEPVIVPTANRGCSWMR